MCCVESRCAFTALCAESRDSLYCVKLIEFRCTLSLVTRFAALCVESFEYHYVLSLVSQCITFIKFAFI